MSDKPVYQSQTGGEWHDVTDKEYAFRKELSGVYKTRILYPAAAYEALQKELGYSKMAADAEAEFANEYKAKFEALQKENEFLSEENKTLKLCIESDERSYNSLKAENEALQKENNSLKLGYKAKEFILQEAQKEVAKLRSFDADNKGLKECNSILTAENEAQAKRIEAIETLCTHDYESKDDFILRVKEILKNGDSK